MSFYMNDVMGASVDEPTESQIRGILSGLEKADEEHPDVSLGHESGWTLSVYGDKTVLWENVEDPDIEPQQVTLPAWDAVVDVLMQVSRGEFDTVSSLLGREQ
ncbi:MULTISPECIES: hypothetical protein [unclassified Streptomyces]|uniref:hypothetical protein n=1 Tax=unclassified Streptomyces TaxID=2593676 RepID=UPI00278C1186|nr:MULTISPECIES: hypothetical protein [unclassified Streptomyces]